MRARPPPALAARTAAPGSDDTTMTDPDGRVPEETTEPGADAAAEAAAIGEADDEGLDEVDAGAVGFDEDEADEEGDEGEEGEEGEAEAASAAVPGTAGAVAAGARGAGRRVGRRAAAEPEHVQTASERAVHIDDRISKIFVLGVAAVFGLIFLNALLLGTGGLFASKPVPTAVPAASAVPSASPAPSASPVPSASPAPSVSPAASGSPAASASPAASGSAAPSAAPTAAPSASASASATPAP